MKVDKLRRLFGAQESLAQYKKQNKAVERETRQISGDDAAVRLAPGLKQTSVQETDASRAERVAQLKSEVRSGEYNPRSEDVAKALVRDLF